MFLAPGPAVFIRDEVAGATIVVCALPGACLCDPVALPNEVKLALWGPVSLEHMEQGLCLAFAVPPDELFGEPSEPDPKSRVQYFKASANLNINVGHGPSSMLDEFGDAAALPPSTNGRQSAKGGTLRQGLGEASLDVGEPWRNTP